MAQLTAQLTAKPTARAVRRRTMRFVARLPLIAVPVLGLVACSGGSGSGGSVQAAPHATDPACVAALRSLPARVLGQPRGNSSAAGTAAWGKPAIVLVCGLDELKPTTDPCLTVDGVDWVIQNASGPFTFATFGRSPAIQVRVPSSYGQQNASAALVDLHAAAAALPRTARACVGG